METSEESVDTAPEVNNEAPENVEVPEGDQVVEPQQDKFEALQNQIGQMANALSSMQSQFGNLQESVKPKPKPADPSELNDLLRTDPALAISKIVEQNNQKLEQKLSGNLNRQTWDAKAHQDFPMNDPKFSTELQATWDYMRSSGLNDKDPKSMYLAAEVTAMRLGKTKKNQASQQHTGESPAPSAPARKKSLIAENDSRLVTYMRTNPSKEKLAAFKAKLEQNESKLRTR